MGFHRLAASLVLLSLLMAAAGVVLGNPLYLRAFMVLAALFLLALLVEPPRRVTIKRDTPGGVHLVGNRCPVSLELEIRGGVGPLVVSDVLPESFLLEEGSNYCLIWKGFLPRRVTFTYTVRFFRSGRFPSPRTLWRSWDLLGLRTGLNGEESEPGPEIVVHPRQWRVKKMRNAETRTGIPYPSGARAVYGVPTLDFRELRQYQHGDPHKYINWKATVRNVRNGTPYPMVNCYEKEGKKTVWIFLDHSRGMELGTSVENSWEYALEAVSTLVSYYLQENMKVGFGTFGSSSHFIYPAAGFQQYRRILRLLITLKGRTDREGKSGEDFKEVFSSPRHFGLNRAAVKYRKHLMGREPLSIVVSRVDPRNLEDLAGGIKRLAGYSRASGGKYPVMVVNIGGYGLAADNRYEHLAADLLKTRDRSYLGKIRRRVHWVEWDPSRTSFYRALRGGEV